MTGETVIPSLSAAQARGLGRRPHKRKEVAKLVLLAIRAEIYTSALCDHGGTSFALDGVNARPSDLIGAVAAAARILRREGFKVSVNETYLDIHWSGS